MRTAVLTDIHANREALSACLAHAQAHGVQRYVFLGDLIGYGGDPAWVLDTVMHHAERGAVAVLGNHEQALLDLGAAASVAADGEHAPGQPRQRMHAEAREAIAWTAAQLAPHHLDFLRRLPYSVLEDDILFVHASACQPEQWEYVRTLTEARRSLQATAARLTFCGHVHKPALYRQNGDGQLGGHIPAADSQVRLNRQYRYLAIPGAVGQPRDGNSNACYAVYDDDDNTLRYFRVPYDFGAAARRVIEVGLPVVFAMRLIEAI